MPRKQNPRGVNANGVEERELRETKGMPISRLWAESPKTCREIRKATDRCSKKLYLGSEKT